MTPTTTSADPSAPVSDEDFVALQRLLLEQCAIELDRRRAYLVDARLGPVVRRYHLPSLGELIRSLRPNNPQLVADTVDALTSNETAFLLTEPVVEPLVEMILPELLARREPDRPLTIWSAACSSGQEPYSLAILLLERYPKLVAAGGIRILASDLSPTMVMRCAAGRFSRIEVNRGLPPEILARRFGRDGRDWVAHDDLKAMISPLVLNLIQPWPGIPRCDLVLLRNVLPFFPDPVRQQVLDRVRRTALQPHGCLILGPDEPALGPQTGYVPAVPTERSCYRTMEAT